MATYEFICEICNELTSTTQSMKEDIVVPDCSKCKTRMRRIYNAAPFRPAPGMYSYKGH